MQNSPDPYMAPSGEIIRGRKLWDLYIAWKIISKKTVLLVLSIIVCNEYAIRWPIMLVGWKAQGLDFNKIYTFEYVVEFLQTATSDTVFLEALILFVVSGLAPILIVSRLQSLRSAKWAQRLWVGLVIFVAIVKNLLIWPEYFD